MKTGIYFNAATCEITSVGPEDEPPGEAWRHVHEDHRLGLLTIRELLRDAHLVEDVRAVYWYFPQSADVANLVFCAEDGDVAAPRTGLTGWLRSALHRRRGPPKALGL